MSKQRYVYYQPNEKSKENKDSYGDCTIRALSKALNVTWIEAFDLEIPICRRAQVSNIFSAPVKIRNGLLAELGFEYHGISNKRGPNVRQSMNSPRRIRAVPTSATLLITRSLLLMASISIHGIAVTALSTDIMSIPNKVYK